MWHGCRVQDRVAVVVGLLVVVLACATGLCTTTTTTDHAMLVARTLRTVGVLLWPSVLYGCVHAFRPSTSSSVPFRTVLPALVWNYAMWIVDVLVTCPATSGPAVSGLRFDATALTGMAFGLSSFLGCRVRSAYSDLFLVSILTCFLVVLPRHDMPRTALRAVVFDNVQTVFLHWSIGLLIAAVLLSRDAPVVTG